MTLREKLRKVWEVILRGHALYTYNELYMNQLITHEEYMKLIKEIETNE